MYQEGNTGLRAPYLVTPTFEVSGFGFQVSGKTKTKAETSILDSSSYAFSLCALRFALCGYRLARPQIRLNPCLFPFRS